MPHDMTPLPLLDKPTLEVSQPILNPSVRDLKPRERLDKMEDWLLAGGPGEKNWDYGQLMNECKTLGCALGWYQYLVYGTTHRDNYLMCKDDIYPSIEFNISSRQKDAIFFGGEMKTTELQSSSPLDIADIIRKVKEGEFEE